MIIPSFDRTQNIKSHFAMWTAVVLNILIFIIIFGQKNELRKYQVLEMNGLQLTGKIYFNYLKNQHQQQYFDLPQWFLKIDPQNSDHLEYIGTYAIRDLHFINQIDQLPTQGDAVEFKKWQFEMHNFMNEFKSENIFTYGLHQQSHSILNWITYQFSHNQVFHLMSNLFFLVFIGAAVENLTGSLMFILIYLFGGFFGGFFFLNMGTHGAIPMIGASASISALLAFYGVWTFQKRIPFFYFFSPLPQHYGQIFLPGWLIFPMILLSDFTSYLSMPDGLGAQVAHTAHIGGAVFGIIFAILLRFLDNILTKTQLLKS